MIAALSVIGCNSPREVVITKWEDNGNKQVTYQITKGTIEVPVNYDYKAYYPDGKSLFKSGQVVNNKEHGKWNFYYRSGKIRSIGTIENGIKIGEFTSFYESGEIEQKGTYTDGEASEIEFFNKDGTGKNKRDDLSSLLVDNPVKWTEKDKQLMIWDCRAPIGSEYFYEKEFCDCIINKVSENVNYTEYIDLTEYQRGIIFGYIISYDQSCTGILEPRDLPSPLRN